MLAQRLKFIPARIGASLALLMLLLAGSGHLAAVLSAPRHAVLAQAAEPAPPAPPPANYSEAGREMGLDINAKTSEWSGGLDAIDQVLESKGLRYRDLDRNRDRLDGIRSDIDQFLETIRPKVEAFRAQVESLGPAPGKDQPPEPEAVAKQRSDWTATLGSLTGAQKAAEAAKLRASHITNKIQDIRRRRFTTRLFERVPEAHSPDAWQSAPANMLYALQQAGRAVANWWAMDDTPGDVSLPLLIALVMAGALGYGARRGVQRVRVWKGPDQPPFWRRGAGAGWLILLGTLPIIAPVAFLYYALHGQDALPADVDRLAYSAMRSILIITTVVTLASTALSPRHPEWRLVPVSDVAAYRIRRLVVALAAIYALNLFLGTVRSVAFAPLSVTVVQSFVASVVIALLVMAILRVRPGVVHADGTPELASLRWFRIPVWIVAALILLAAAGGYISLARFLSAQLIVTGTILAIVYLLMIWIDAFGQSMSDENAVTGRWMMETFKCEKRRCEQFALPVTLGLKLVVLLLSVPLILLQWGFDWKDIVEWSRELFVGFRIGNTQISIAAILASVLVFALGYAAARLFQGWLDRQILEPAGVSGSVRNSIRTAVGYVGVVIAALIAISYAGLDLSNVALVAGALSVGIGLGLQGVVNNFVSGLILLVERPVKVGDWVVIGGEEGLVRRISVRSTEIETFDRANVLVPNASLITEKVKNWTLHNYSGRIIIPVEVHYDNKPRHVQEVLLGVARSHSQVMTNPEPVVSLDEFGKDALVFKLFVYVYDLTKGGSVRTELRMAILEAFQEAGIGAPNGTKPAKPAEPQPARSPERAEFLAAARARRRQRFHERTAAKSNGNGHGRRMDS